MSAEMWRSFVRHAKSKVLKLFGEHISKLVDYERNSMLEVKKRGKKD